MSRVSNWVGSLLIVFLFYHFAGGSEDYCNKLAHEVIPSIRESTDKCMQVYLPENGFVVNTAASVLVHLVPREMCDTPVPARVCPRSIAHGVRPQSFVKVSLNTSSTFTHAVDMQPVGDSLYSFTLMPIKGSSSHALGHWLHDDRRNHPFTLSLFFLAGRATLSVHIDFDHCNDLYGLNSADFHAFTTAKNARLSKSASFNHITMTSIPFGARSISTFVILFAAVCAVSMTRFGGAAKLCHLRWWLL